MTLCFLQINRNLQQTASIIKNHFGEVPLIEYDNGGGNIGCRSLMVSAASFEDQSHQCEVFLEELSGSEDPYAQLSSFRAIDESTRRVIKSTVLGSEACIAYGQLVRMHSRFKDIELEALFSFGLRDGWGSHEFCIQSHTWAKFVFWLGVLLSSFSEAQVLFSPLIFVLE